MLDCNTHTECHYYNILYIIQHIIYVRGVKLTPGQICRASSSCGGVQWQGPIFEQCQQGSKARGNSRVSKDFFCIASALPACHWWLCPLEPRDFEFCSGPCPTYPTSQLLGGSTCQIWPMGHMFATSDLCIGHLVLGTVQIPKKLILTPHSLHSKYTSQVKAYNLQGEQTVMDLLQMYWWLYCAFGGGKQEKQERSAWNFIFVNVAWDILLEQELTTWKKKSKTGKTERRKVK